MQFVRPQLFTEAVQKLGARTPVGATLSSEQWARVPVALRERAFFSAKVQDARFLSDAKGFLDDFLQGTRETLPNGETALKVGGRAQFVEKLQAYAVAAGMEPLDPKARGGLKDPTSEKRLGLIFDTAVKAAQDFGTWKQGQDPDLLDAFPAQRFIRVRDARAPRADHLAHEGDVRLKSDLAYWIARNPFGVPWGPWGFGSGMDVEDVSREDAEDDGVLKPGAAVEPVDRDLNDQLQASTRGLDPAILDRLKGEFGDQVEIAGDQVRWRAGSPSPARVPVPEAAPATAPSRSAPEDAPSEEPAVAGPHYAPQPPAEPARPAPEAKPLASVVNLRVGPGVAAACQECLTAADRLHAVGDLPPLPIVELPASADDHGQYDPDKHQAAVHPETYRPGLTTGHELFHGILTKLLVAPNRSLRDPAKARQSLGAGPLYEWYRAVAGTPTAAALARDARVFRRGSQGKFLEYLLRPEEMLGRSYAQYVALRSGSPGLLAELELYREKAPQETWSLEEFGPVLTAIDHFLSEQGWR